MNFPENKKIILFDGVCNLCNSGVQIIIKHDKNDVFRFVSLQSDLGKNILQHIGVFDKNIDSFIFYEPNVAYYIKSDAALEIAKNLGGLFYFAFIFKIMPTFLRDKIYDYIAINRYAWFGKKESCMLPNPEFAKKFLEI
jgi:predicted DCC family thiol-disulfide oxidoreductase YuxK